MPTHYSISSIRKTLNSIVNQRLNFEENIEIIIVDNFHLEDIKEICQEYMEKYPNNISYIEINSDSTNYVRLNDFKGEYVCFLENSDYLSKNSLYHVLKFIKEHPTINSITIPLYYYKNHRREKYLDYEIDKTSTYNLLKNPEYIQLLGPSTFLKSEILKSGLSNNYNEYLAFLNEVLLDKPSIGICKDGGYYLEYIKEKLLPTEDIVLNNDTYNKFIQNNLITLISKCKEKYGNIPKFTQYALLNQIKWPLSIEKSEETLDLSKLKEIIQHIDDEVIFDNILLEEELKTFIFLLKYDKLSDELIKKLNLNTIFIDVYDIINNELNILGHIDNFKKRDVKLFVNDKEIPMNKIRFPQNDKHSLGYQYLTDYSFEVKIPLSTKKQYKLEFKSNDIKLDIDFSRPCNFSKSVGYAKSKHFISIHKDNEIIIKKKTALNWIYQEMKTTINMIKNHEEGFEKAIPFRILYMLGYPFLKNRKIWFYMDRPDESDDNGLHLFKYSIKQNENIDKYFVLSKDNEDYDEIKKIGKVLPYKSIKHRYLGLFVENIITSHPDNEIIYPFWGGYPFLAGLLRSNNIFLQHGVLKDDISYWLNKSNMNLSLFLVSSNKEYESIFKNPYNYDKDVIQLKGLPRYDNLKNVKGKKQIIIMPSWRRYLTSKSWEYIQETEYFQRFNSLINNEKLIEKAKEYNYEIIFRPHPNVYNYIKLYQKNDYVKIDYEKTKFQTLFNNGSLMVTDYSSVAFDFAYLKKPTLYYQYSDDYHFDSEKSFFDYETMGFGEICKNESELVDLIIEYMENDCKIKKKYSYRIDDFFVFHDKNNCKRVHETIKKIPLKD